MSKEFITSISIDSRKIKKGDLYIAIKGKRFDGNRFVKDALEKGAIYAIISDSKYQDSKTILVNSGKKALSDIASYLVNKIQPIVIAITGSNGKTTTKELIVSIMRCYLTANQLVFSEGNFNNDIGLPLTLLKLNFTHTHAILEMGMNHAGELNQLTKIASPDLAVITNIGEAHIENFESRKDIATAKKEILNDMPSGAIAILPRDDQYFNYLAQGQERLEIISFGRKANALIYGEEISSGILKIFVPNENFIISKKLLGKNNTLNILAAVACCYALNISKDCIQKGIEIMDPIPGRLELLLGIENSTVINDTYNANPSSTDEAINVLTATKGKKLFVFGDMAELGRDSVMFHEEIGKYINKTQINLTLGVGEFSKETIKQLGEKGMWFQSKTHLIEELIKLIDSKTTILVKGSRLMEMEQIISKIIK